MDQLDSINLPLYLGPYWPRQDDEETIKAAIIGLANAAPSRNVQLESPQFIMVQGPTGVGKSTMLMKILRNGTFRLNHLNAHFNYVIWLNVWSSSKRRFLEQLCDVLCDHFKIFQFQNKEGAADDDDDDEDDKKLAPLSYATSEKMRRSLSSFLSRNRILLVLDDFGDPKILTTLAKIGGSKSIKCIIVNRTLTNNQFYEKALCSITLRKLSHKEVYEILYESGWKFSNFRLRSQTVDCCAGLPARIRDILFQLEITFPNKVCRDFDPEMLVKNYIKARRLRIDSLFLYPLLLIDPGQKISLELLDFVWNFPSFNQVEITTRRLCEIGILNRFYLGEGCFYEMSKLMFDTIYDNAVSHGWGNNRQEIVFNSLGMPKTKSKLEAQLTLEIRSDLRKVTRNFYARGKGRSLRFLIENQTALYMNIEQCTKILKHAFNIV